MLSQAIRRDDLNTTPPMKRILPILALLFFGVDASAAPAKPDFCVFLIDDLRADRLGSYCYAHVLAVGGWEQMSCVRRPSARPAQK